MLNAVINNTGIGPNDIWNGATVASSINSTVSGQFIADVIVDVISNDTLSGLTARNGITIAAGNAILVTAQTDNTQNGIYSAASGAWSRYKWTGSAFATDSTMTTYSQLGYNYGFFRANGKFYQVIIQKPSATFGNSAVYILPSVLTSAFQTPSNWTPNTTVRAGQQAIISTTYMSDPYYFFAGEVVSSNSLRTTRSTFDSVEAANWTLRQGNGNFGKCGLVVFPGGPDIPANSVASIMNVTLPNVGLYLLTGSVRFQGPWNGGNMGAYFTTTFNGSTATAINNSCRMWLQWSPNPNCTDTGGTCNVQIYYYNDTANKVVYLNGYNSSSVAMHIYYGPNGETVLWYTQLR